MGVGRHAAADLAFDTDGRRRYVAAELSGIVVGRIDTPSGGAWFAVVSVCNDTSADVDEAKFRATLTRAPQLIARAPRSGI
ncbi:MAG: hypothetical protein K8T90_10930 [Planctomycetes bacterium]|nr:hypothetical protein [Planctomycetota bacterium]